jgi:hypothetical protein
MAYNAFLPGGETSQDPRDISGWVKSKEVKDGPHE